MDFHNRCRDQILAQQNMAAEITHNPGAGVFPSPCQQPEHLPQNIIIASGRSAIGIGFRQG